jgi:hypothetical protein
MDWCGCESVEGLAREVSGRSSGMGKGIAADGDAAGVSAADEARM